MASNAMEESCFCSSSATAFANGKRLTGIFGLAANSKYFLRGSRPRAARPCSFSTGRKTSKSISWGMIWTSSRLSLEAISCLFTLRRRLDCSKCDRRSPLVCDLIPMRPTLQLVCHLLALNDGRINAASQDAPRCNDQRAWKSLLSALVDCSQQIVSVVGDNDGNFPLHARNHSDQAIVSMNKINRASGEASA